MRERIVLIVSFVMALFLTGCRTTGSKQKEVVVYTSLDKVFSQPILEEFEQQTGRNITLSTRTELHSY
jgi:ABC-type Zn uptake system ZnuABC Zn-binding protein ZnuA